MSKIAKTFFYGFVILVFLALIGLGIYKLVSKEKYRRFENIGLFPLTGINRMTIAGSDDDDESTYGDDDIRYVHKRRYNFLNRQNIRNLL